MKWCCNHGYLVAKRSALISRSYADGGTLSAIPHRWYQNLGDAYTDPTLR